MSNVGDTHESVVLDVHLCDVPDPGHVLEVGDERQSLRPASGSGQPEPPRDDRPQSVSADHESRSKPCRTVAENRRRLDAIAIELEVRQPRSFGDPRPGIARPLEEQLVEHLAAHRQTAITEGHEAMAGDELAANHRAIRSPNDDTLESRRAGLLDRGKRVHVAKNPRRLWTQVLGTGLGAGETS